MFERFGPFANKALPAVLAFLLPAAGIVLTLVALGQERREDAQRIGLATVFGACLYAAIFL